MFLFDDEIGYQTPEYNIFLQKRIQKGKERIN
jgi:hypothetical protein